MAVVICPTSGRACEARGLCVSNREAYATMVEATSRIEDTFLGRVVGLIARFRNLSDMPHYAEKTKAEEGIKKTEEVLARECPGEEECIAADAFTSGELQIHPLAQS